MISKNSMAIQTIKSYLGYSRHDCRQRLAQDNIESIAFAHWLVIPSHQLLLVFRHQRCVAIDHFQSVA